VSGTTPTHAEAEALLARYAWAIDGQEYDELAEVFSEDVHADYEAFEVHGAAALVDRMRELHEGLAATQHLVGSVLVSNSAEPVVRSHVVATLVRGRGSARSLVRIGASYRDRLVAGPRGWRIAERHVRGRWWDGDADILPWMRTAGEGR
jgi:3-phenylpropionate/cinnamic acid dioxygenase small subunit